jgi:capsular polysaccharide transport system permease protein
MDGNSLWQGWAIQKRVTGALIMREIYTRFGRDNLGFAWIVVEPLIFVLPVMAMWSALRPRYDHGIATLPFLWSGYLPLLLFRHLGFRMIAAIKLNVPLLYHRSVTIYDIFFARAIVEVASNLLAAAASYLVLYILGAAGAPRDVPLFFLGYFYAVWWALAIGSILAGLSERFTLVEKIWPPISYMYLPVCGFFFLQAWLPESIRNIMRFLPSVNSYEMLRAGLFGGQITFYYDTTLTTYICAGLTLYGLLLLHDTRRYLTLD